MPIRFFYQNVRFKIKNPVKIKKWIIESAKKERCSISEISYILCSDNFLLKLNQDFLGHNTLTDIITFNYSEGKSLSCEVYVSVKRVKENSRKFKCEFDEELKRVLIHGILHLAGYNDKLKLESNIMRKKEDAYLSLYKKMFHVKP